MLFPNFTLVHWYNVKVKKTLIYIDIGFCSKFGPFSYNVLVKLIHRRDFVVSANIGGLIRYLQVLLSGHWLFLIVVSSSKPRDTLKSKSS